MRLSSTTFLTILLFTVVLNNGTCSDYIAKINYTAKEAHCPSGTTLMWATEKNVPDAPNIELAELPKENGKNAESICIKRFNLDDIHKAKKELESITCPPNQEHRAQAEKQGDNVVIQSLCIDPKTKKKIYSSKSIIFTPDFKDGEIFYPLVTQEDEYINGITLRRVMYKLGKYRTTSSDYSVSCPSGHSFNAVKEDSEEIRFCASSITGKRNGPALVTTEDGTLKKGNYFDDLKSGKWEVFYPSGKKQAEFNYKVINGKSVAEGPITSYHENGNKIKSGNMKNGLKEGVWSYWYENGNLWKTGLMLKDDPSGKWTCYNENNPKLIGQGNCQYEWSSAW